MARNRRVIPIFCASSGILKIVIIRFMIGPLLGDKQTGLSACHVVFAGRGFILFFLGFLGGGITSAMPPLAVIFSVADFEKWWARMTKRFDTSPVPRIRAPSEGPLARPASRRAA